MSGAKAIRKTWFQYMIDQYTKTHSTKYGKYDKTQHSIRDDGNVVVTGRLGKETLEEVGMDYRTFKLKFDTSDNPMGL
jgi:hypothetical protein